MDLTHSARRIYIGVIASWMIIIASSCAPVNVYQVYKFESDDADQNFVYSDGDLKLKYDLWAEDGKVGVSIFNSTRKPVYIHWEKSSIIVNSESRSLFNNTSVTVGSGTEQLFLIKRTFRSDPATVSRSSGVSLTSHPYRYTFLPPESGIEVEFLDGNLTPFSFNCEFQPDKKNELKKITFKQEESPYKIRFYLSYSEKPEGSGSVIDNSMWVNEVLVMSSDEFKGERIRVNDCEGDFSTYVNSYPYYSPGASYATESFKNTNPSPLIAILVGIAGVVILAAVVL